MRMGLEKLKFKSSMYKSFLQMFKAHLHSKRKEKQGKMILVSECEFWVKIAISCQRDALGRRRGALGLRILCYFARAQRIGLWARCIGLARRIGPP